MRSQNKPLCLKREEELEKRGLSGETSSKELETVPSAPLVEIYSVQYILLRKHGSSEDCSAGEARREEK